MTFEMVNNVDSLNYVKVWDTLDGIRHLQKKWAGGKDLTALTIRLLGLAKAVDDIDIDNALTSTFKIDASCMHFF